MFAACSSAQNKKELLLLQEGYLRCGQSFERWT